LPERTIFYHFLLDDAVVRNSFGNEISDTSMVIANNVLYGSDEDEGKQKLIILFL
jgi:hypothetical protein